MFIAIRAATYNFIFDQSGNQVNPSLSPTAQNYAFRLLVRLIQHSKVQIYSTHNYIKQKSTI